MKFPVALQLYSIRGDVEANMESALKQVKDLGYDGVEFAGLFHYDPQEVHDLCEKIGLTPISAHVNLKAMLKDPEGELEKYRIIGCRYVVIPHVGSEYYPDEGDFNALLQAIELLSPIAKAKGMQLGYHNHDFEFTHKTADGERMLDAMYRIESPDVLKTQLDTCWVNVGGENPADYIRKFPGRCPTVHLKDFVGKKSGTMYALIGVENDAEKQAATNRDFCLRPVGYGLQDIPSILSAAHDVGSEWVIVEQDQPSMDKSPMECAKMSIEYLKTVNV